MKRDLLFLILVINHDFFINEAKKGIFHYALKVVNTFCSDSK